MATVYLHIGLPKTGTTAIQNFLGNNREILQSHDLCFPDFGLRYPRVNSFRNAYFVIDTFEEYIGHRDLSRPEDGYLAILDQIAELGKQYNRIILTDESLWRFGDSFPEFWKKLDADLEKRKLGLRIIVYLRRQDNFVLSFYRQKVKAVWTGLPFYEYLDEFKKDYRMDYRSYLDMLSDCIGREKLIVRVYEKEQFQGEEHSLLSDFLSIFGLSLKDGFNAEHQEYNPTLYGPRFELQRVLNTLPVSPFTSRALRKSFRSMQDNNPYANPPEKDSFFKTGEQSAFLDRFAESNSSIARDYLGREDGTLFYSKEDIDLPEYKADTDALLHDVILFYGRSVQLLEEELKNARREIKTLRKELRKELHKEIRDVREDILFYRLKRKLRHLFGKES